MFIRTTATDKLLTLTKRIRGVAGGTSAGKTISILQILIDQAQTNDNKLISVVSETFPHLRRGAMRDFLNIMQQHGYYQDKAWTKTDFTYTFSTGSKIEFFSADMPGKVRGPRRDILFVNEANNIGYEEFDQLRIRTADVIWLDWNPTHEFWWYTEVMPHYDVDFETLTYIDNQGLGDEIVKDIESHKHNRQWWLVYGLGQLGEIESRIYRGWGQLDEIPEEAELVSRGLDFGYSNDPTAIINIYKYESGFILDELMYRKGWSNKNIATFLLSLPEPDILVHADSAEPKSIDELIEYGVNVAAAQKGPGSVNQGIQYVQNQSVFYTTKSLNLIKEYRNYLWQEDKDGRLINKPEDINNHLMDALRYGLETYVYASMVDTGFIKPPFKEPAFKQGVTSLNGQSLEPVMDIRSILEEKNQRDWRSI